MTTMESAAEYHHRTTLEWYLMAWPLERFWINFWRRRSGEPPLRARDARTELAAIRRRLKEREAAWDAKERAMRPRRR